MLTTRHPATNPWIGQTRFPPSFILNQEKNLLKLEWSLNQKKKPIPYSLIPSPHKGQFPGHKEKKMFTKLLKYIAVCRMKKFFFSSHEVLQHMTWHFHDHLGHLAWSSIIAVLGGKHSGTHVLLALISLMQDAAATGNCLGYTQLGRRKILGKWWAKIARAEFLQRRMRVALKLMAKKVRFTSTRAKPLQ
jgi:hypothetical protein